MYKCSQCEFQNGKVSRVLRHLAQIHKDTSVLLCTECAYATRNETSLNMHLQNTKKDFSKPLCNKTENKEQVDAFIDVSDPTKVSSFQGKLCKPINEKDGIVLIGKGKYGCKMRNIYKCSQCEYQDQKIGRLLRHLAVIHKDVSVLLCPDCEYATRNEFSLNIHIRKRDHSKSSNNANLSNINARYLSRYISRYSIKDHKLEAIDNQYSNGNKEKSVQMPYNLRTDAN